MKWEWKRVRESAFRFQLRSRFCVGNLHVARCPTGSSVTLLANLAKGEVENKFFLNEARGRRRSPASEKGSHRMKEEKEFTYNEKLKF